jgi:hypothetical protein
MYIANDFPSFMSLGPPDQVLCRTPTTRPDPYFMGAQVFLGEFHDQGNNFKK